jgi:HD-GYP domain-containing protein (c-di-GMP phosphodiesterase class II)
MRYVTINHLSKGMLLARNLYDENFDIYLKEGVKLSAAQVDAIKKRGYPGNYILDACSDEVVADTTIPDDIFLTAAAAVARAIGQAKAHDSHLVKASVDEQKEIILPVIAALRAKPQIVVEAVDVKPAAGYDFYHAAMVMVLSLAIGIKLDLNDEQLFELGVAALLHDIGNVFLPFDLLNRPGSLTDEEFVMVKNHVQMGYDYLTNNISLSPTAALGALQHHENYDGTGYPQGLRRKNISLYGRIIAIMDVYDALVSKRSFRAAMFPMQALDVVQQHADRKFDPDIAEKLSKIIAPYPTGTVVQLKTGEACLVLRNFAEDLSSPLLQIFDGKTRAQRMIDMRTDKAYKNVRITKILDV